MRTWLAALALFLAVPAPPATATSFGTKAQQAILVDMSTGTVLFEKNADARMPTASMSKLMTMYMVFEALKEGGLSLDDSFRVSEKAWRTGGSKMFVEVGDSVRIEDLIRGVIVQSGNDATIVLAEGLNGSEAEFAAQMTRRAQRMGLLNSNFMNAHGLPDPNHYSTARDLALLAQRLIGDFPEYYHYYSETEFTYGIDVRTGQPITQPNRNPLLYRDSINADGMKTGFTTESGYGLVASAIEGDRRLVAVINGLAQRRDRGDEAERLLRWGFREFDTYQLFTEGETVEAATVWLGEEPDVPLVIDEDVIITLSREDREALQVKVVVTEPIAAPVTAGTQLGEVVISAPQLGERRVPLSTGAEVASLGTFGRMIAAARHIVLGTAQQAAGQP